MKLYSLANRNLFTNYKINPNAAKPQVKFLGGIEKDVFEHASRLESRPQTASLEGNSRDGFTGLRDKRYLISRLNEKRNLAIKNNKPLSVAMFDMDNFKSINEFLGYSKGDEFIKAIAKSVQHTARQDKRGSHRFGGEEFVVIIEEPSKEDIIKICKNISKEVEEGLNSKEHIELYKSSANALLSKLLDTQVYVDEINKTKTRLSLLDEMIAKDNSLQHNDVVMDTLLGDVRYIQKLYSSFLSISISNENNEDVRNKLLFAKNIIEDGIVKQKYKVYSNSNLTNYIYKNFDKGAQIAQIKSWLSDFDGNNGFTITCGVAEFSPEVLKSHNAQGLINAAGEVLKHGKQFKKGEVYYEEI